jgi:hypothetical protein
MVGFDAPGSDTSSNHASPDTGARVAAPGSSGTKAPASEQQRDDEAQPLLAPPACLPELTAITSPGSPAAQQLTPRLGQPIADSSAATGFGVAPVASRAVDPISGDVGTAGEYQPLADKPDKKRSRRRGCLCALIGWWGAETKD